MWCHIGIPIKYNLVYNYYNLMCSYWYTFLGVFLDISKIAMLMWCYIWWYGFETLVISRNLVKL